LLLGCDHYKFGAKKRNFDPSETIVKELASSFKKTKVAMAPLHHPLK
jgi:hypothetical protein